MVKLVGKLPLQVRVETWGFASRSRRLAPLLFQPAAAFSERVSWRNSPVGTRGLAARARRLQQTSAGTPQPGRRVWGLLPEKPAPTPCWSPFTSRRLRLGVPRRPSPADARAAGSRRSASSCHLEPQALAGTFPLGLSLRSLLRFSELSRQRPARSFACNPLRAYLLPGDTPRPRRSYSSRSTDVPPVVCAP